MPGLFDGTPFQRPIHCTDCGHEAAACTCPRNVSGEVCQPSDQQPRVHREKRRGKWCTIIGKLDANATDLKRLLKTLRTSLGTGGGISNNELIIQGDHRDAVVAKLIELGYRANSSGG